VQRRVTQIGLASMRRLEVRTEDFVSSNANILVCENLKAGPPRRIKALSYKQKASRVTRNDEVP